MTRTVRLNDIQLVILSTAATRDDHMAFPLPDSLDHDDPVTGKAITSLVRRKLLEEVEVSADTPSRRTDGDRHLSLKATDKALDAIGIEQSDNATSRAHKKDHNNGSSHYPRPVTKAGTVLTLLRRKNGASIETIIEATGWQAHSVRGFLSGTVKKRMGLKVISEKNAKGERCYSISTGT